MSSCLTVPAEIQFCGNVVAALVFDLLKGTVIRQMRGSCLLRGAATIGESI